MGAGQPQESPEQQRLERQQEEELKKQQALEAQRKKELGQEELEVVKRRQGLGGAGVNMFTANGGTQRLRVNLGGTGAGGLFGPLLAAPPTARTRQLG